MSGVALQFLPDGGRCVDPPAIRAIAGDRGLKLIDDSRHAIGASYDTGDGGHREGSITAGSMIRASARISESKESSRVGRRAACRFAASCATLSTPITTEAMPDMARTTPNARPAGPRPLSVARR